MTIQLQTRAKGTLTVALLLTLTSSGAWGSAQGSLEVPEPNEQISSTTAAKSSPDEENLRSASGAADPTSREQTDDEAFAEDAAKVAARKGWSLEEAQERLRHQDDFGTLSAHFRRQYPEIYAAAKVVHGKDSTRYIARFVGAVPEDARTKAEQLGIDVTFLDDAPASEVELQHRADGIVEDLASTRFKSFTWALGPSMG